jgi:hypothetical protein
MADKKSTTFERVKNGYIVSLTLEKEVKGGIDWETTKYIAKTPKEAKKLLLSLIK